MSDKGRMWPVYSYFIKWSDFNDNNVRIAADNSYYITDHNDDGNIVIKIIIGDNDDDCDNQK